jgi:hypothetical protein
MHKVSALGDKAAQVWAILGALAFLTSGTLYLWLGRWTVTEADYWPVYNFCLKHTWLESALHKHNSHSLIFPSFFWLADLKFFHGMQLPLFLAGIALLFISVAVLLVPVWCDETVDLTAKMIAIFVVIASNFWLARVITASGALIVSALW